MQVVGKDGHISNDVSKDHQNSKISNFIKLSVQQPRVTVKH